MAANIEKTSLCFRALGLFLGNVLTLKFPLWLYIVVSAVSVLFCLFVSCAYDSSVQRVVVGHCVDRGHSYVMFRPETNPDALVVLHDPDCSCWCVEPLNFDE